MKTLKMQKTYTYIIKTIQYVRENPKNHFNLDKIAAKLQLSREEFQRLFTDWADILPEEFLEYINPSRIREDLKIEVPSLFGSDHNLGISHDQFITISPYTLPIDRNDRENISINYSFNESSLGDCLIASLGTSICYMAFYKKEEEAFIDMKNTFPDVTLSRKSDEIQNAALTFFQKNETETPQINLRVNATPFQLKVWEALLRIPLGQVRTYKQIAQYINQPSASRAVGTAIGNNTIAYFIPCHRVIRTTGVYGGFKWGGTTQKATILAWEKARTKVNT